MIGFSLWGTNNAIAATALEAAIPQGSLFDVISARAKKLAEQDYIAPKNIQIEALNSIDYQDYRSIRFKHDQSVWKLSLYNTEAADQPVWGKSRGARIR